MTSNVGVQIKYTGTRTNMRTQKRIHRRRFKQLRHTMYDVQRTTDIVRRTRQQLLLDVVTTPESIEINHQSI